jgi:hypothetical protein
MPNGVPAFEAAPYIVPRSMEYRVRNQRSEIRRQRSGVKLISDLRLLTSVIDDFYEFNDLNGFNDFNSLPFTAHY